MPEKIDLPLSVAMTIVLQGLRIRLGRSLVTISGVLLGIAFLTSTMTMYLVKDAVGAEDRIRGDVRRMHNFLAAELGTTDGKTIAVFDGGDASEVETRLLARLSKESAKIGTSVNAADADAALVIGSKETVAKSLTEMRDIHFKKPVAVTRLSRDEINSQDSLYLIPLSTELTAEEAAQLAQEKTTARYRVFWILAVALAVTLMGITNAMLMSVTERFREIGTMKCLGATSRLVRRIFLIESLIVGISGGFSGALAGSVFSMLFYAVVYGPSLVANAIDVGLLLLCMIGAVVAGVLLTVISAIYPASVASSMVPATALRSNF